MTGQGVLTERVVVKPGAFHDPMTLMEASRVAREVAGVEHVAVGMVEPLNMVVFTQRFGYSMPDGSLGPNDLVIALRADGEEAADAALRAIDACLAARVGEREVREVGPFVLGGDRNGDRVDRVRWEVAEPASRPDLLERLVVRTDRIAAANDEVLARMQAARPLVVDVATAGDVLPDMSARTFLHAGPPVAWADMCGPLRGAVIGAALLEGLADDPEDAMRRAERGEFEFAPGHERGALGPMAGVISASMPLWVIENATHGNRAHCTFSEGLGGPFRFGAYADWVIARLRWIREVLAPVVRSALGYMSAPLDLRAMGAAAVQMGDEVHNRNFAATAQLFRALAPALMEADAPNDDKVKVARYIADDLFFYLNLSMASGKATADAASGVADSTIVTTMARNGTEFGLRVSGTGDRWFTAPSSVINGCYLPGYGPADANPDMGDSTITETIGLGGLIWAGAPSIARFAGVTAEDAVRATLAMYDITWGESENYRIPVLGYRGAPLGIDCRKVLETGIVPIADTGIAHREPGVGIIGGGYVRPPMAAFTAALEALAGQA